MSKRENFEARAFDTLEKNLHALKEYYPALFERFKDYKEKRYHFVFDASGDFNIYDTESQSNLYSDDPVNFCSKTFLEYKKKPVHFARLFGIPSELSYKVNPVHGAAITKLCKLKMLQAQLGVGKPAELRSRIPSMLFTNVGIGLDIEYVFMAHDVVNGIVAEPDEDIFYASLFVCRWYEIFKKQEENGRALSIYVGFKPEDMVSLFHEHFYGVGRYKNNGIFLYSPIDVRGEEYYRNVADYVQSALLDGFGFYDDALYSLSATVHNTKNKVPIYINPENSAALLEANTDVPVFIIGAGPSLDQDLEYVKKYQDKAFIISCGSGMKSLEVHGIKPDLHVECERTAITTHWLEQVDPEFLKSTGFIGLNVIHPDLFSCFKRSGMMVKGMESGSMLMATKSSELTGEEKLPMFSFLNPTVVHMGVGVAPFLGFRKLYFFGTDMGYKNPEDHHSSSSSYSDITDEYKKKLVPENSFEVPANFSEEPILSDETYTSFKIFLESELNYLGSFFQGLECFNCSDGAKIRFTEPFRSEGLSFLEDSAPVDKAAIVSGIFDNFFEVQDGLGEAVANQVESDIPLLLEVCREMEERFSTKVESIDEYQKILDECNSYLFHNEETIPQDKIYILSLFSGSLLYYLSALNSVAYSPVFDDEENLEFAGAGMKFISEFFKEVADTFEDNYLKVDNADFYDYFG